MRLLLVTYPPSQIIHERLELVLLCPSVQCTCKFLVVHLSVWWVAGPSGRGNSSTSPDSCADWEGNNSTLGFGGDLASEAAAINASEGQLDPITSFPSGGILPSLRFSVLDHFGNLVSGVCSHLPLCPPFLCVA